MPRYIALDYGNKRVGIAISDEIPLFASPYKTIINEGHTPVIDTITEIIEKENVERIVVGLPSYYDGEESPQTLIVKSFIEELENRIEIPIVTYDERYSSQEAIAHLKSKKQKATHKKKGLIDQMAATIILQGYLDSLK